MRQTSSSRSQRVIAALATAATLVLSAAAGAQDKGDAKIELWDGQRALAHIADLLRFTPRAIDTPGHQQAIDYIKTEMAKTSADAVTTQRWDYKDEAGKSHAMTNIIARFQPANPRRMIVATHYDSIVHAYRDAQNPKARMPGANNSASGVAVLLETARVLSLLPKPAVGIDMIFFDGEEGPKALGAGDPDWHPIGSPYFTAHLHDYYPTAKPEKAVVFDMVCDRDLELKPEPSSLASAMPEVKKFWSAGLAIAPKAFSTKTTSYPISDDHTALAAAGIPSFLVIDFEYEPYFNTTQDTIDKCSAGSLEAVGRTLLQYLYLP
ncbi:M28 family peptidase [Bradyrhizobium sp. ARR65]|uniref:M28 family peptidase n=1 Tax=Bradyrhizobium sp. ARR65 TaxID=1040989 RepID=UPI000464E4F5|nr:M28 family peptidase [Bradyrhizobium sp. ARR65]